MDRQLIEWCGGLRDETLNETDFARLQERLKSDPEALRYYLRFQQMHSMLEDLPPSAPEPLSRPGRFRRTPRLVWGSLAAAACAVFAWISLKPDPSPAGITYVGTLIYSEDNRWAPGRTLVEGDRLASGHRLHLLEGHAVVRFDGGAELILSGDTRVDLLSAGHGKLWHGEVVVRAEDGAEGFTLDTPETEFIDLGTEFAVKVEKSGGTELHVHDGRVEYRNQGDGDVLEGGKALRFDGVGGETTSVALAAPGFQETMRRINPQSRAELMRAYSGFHYNEGLLPLEEANRGKGWSSPWRLRLPEERFHGMKETTPDRMRIVHGEMNVPWPVPGGRLGMLEMPPGSFYVRELTRPLRMDKHLVWYFSLMVRETERPAESRRPQEALRLTFRDSTDYRGRSLTFGHGPSFQPRVQNSNGEVFFSPYVLPEEQTTLWIGKVITRKHAPDEVYFRIYGEQDQLDFAEPLTWHVAERQLRMEGAFDRVLLSSTGRSPRLVDELRIGPTWRSVAPIQPPSQP